MNKMINITLKNNDSEICTCSVTKGTSALTLLDNFSESNKSEKKIIAVKVNNEIRSSDTKLNFNAFVEPVFLDSPDGAAIYRRSLCLLLASACHMVLGNKRILVGHSLDHSYFYTTDLLSGESEITEEQLLKIQNQMNLLVKKNVPIVTEEVSYEEAESIFKKLHLTETLKQLEFRCVPSIKISSIENFSDINFGPLAINAGILKTFELKKYNEGFLLRFPKQETPDILSEFNDSPKLSEIYSKYKQWGRRVDVTSAASLNKMIATRKINDFIDIAETFQQKNIANIATQIAEKKNVRVVLIAGPSSSGKTTTSKKLALELMAMGYKPKLIELDRYYKGREFTPIGEDGKPDFECLEALNIDMLNQNLIDLFDGKEVILPAYDFTSGKSFLLAQNKMHLEQNELLIMEGIHGLNDKLTPKIPAEYKFKIYLSALTQLNLDDHNRISTSDNRLIRRIVRDANFRGKEADGTIEMWPNVRLGESKHIFPFQNNADAMLNTALDYELSVLRVYAEPLLLRVKPSSSQYGEARRLLSFLENFSTIGSEKVPPRSIIREFIGGSAFKY